MKAGRGEIAEICDSATRIVSNSGQAVLRVAVQEMKAGKNANGFAEVADYATRLSILLELKSYLRSLRSSGVQQQTPEEMADTGTETRSLPRFAVASIILTSGPLCEDPLFPSSSGLDQMKQLKLFRKLMRNDASDLLSAHDVDEVRGSVRSSKRRKAGRPTR